jgi:hypothetical protein
MPCALMLDLAESLNPYLEARKRLVESGNDLEEEEAAETTLQLIFFDGEEAFKDWTDTDSTYGSRCGHSWVLGLDSLSIFQAPCRKMGTRVHGSASPATITPRRDHPQFH